MRARVPNNRGFRAGIALLALIVLLALLAPVLAPHDPYAQVLARRLMPPIWNVHGTWAHPLGTDALGRDYASRLLYGARASLLIGAGVMVVAGVIGTALGLAAGYLGGWVDALAMFLIAARLSVPSILVAMAVVALVGSSMGVVIVVLGLLLWPRFTVVLRTATQRVAAQDYVLAARAAGASDLRIFITEILPNVCALLAVVASLEMAHAILLEAALSFLGLGVQPPQPSWGLMVAEGKPFLLFQPYLIAIPGSALMVLVLAIHLVGDGLRDDTLPGGAE